LYHRSSSRKDENTGDAAALAYEAGAALRDMEFVQFHPTGMIEPEEMGGMLVTEAVRGEGGHLYNKNGERFMRRYSPEHLELDARDVVARANYEEIQAGRGTENGAVLLDVSHREPRRIKERLPKMYEQFKEQGVDITKEPMQVAPTAHYAMGGVEVDFDTGATTLDGLFAVGEGTAGTHGANRLGGNSLAETLVFGRITGAHLARYLADAPSLTPDPAAIENTLRVGGLRGADGEHDPEDWATS
jgi:succinate dehydrogenase / fumarate reductase flavoprotein subunit